MQSRCELHGGDESRVRGAVGARGCTAGLCRWCHGAEQDVLQAQCVLRGVLRAQGVLNSCGCPQAGAEPHGLKLPCVWGSLVSLQPRWGPYAAQGWSHAPRFPGVERSCMDTGLCYGERVWLRSLCPLVPSL